MSAAARQESPSSSQKRNNAGKLAGGRTKEELLALRKAMMKPSGLSKKNTESSFATDSQQDSAQKKMPVELMDRLAKGTRVEVSKKEMKALTNKNYENLPEVRKRREEEKKKEDFKLRQQRAKELEQKRKDDLRSQRSGSSRQ